jgi:predicted O-methyltransferase YrrM
MAMLRVFKDLIKPYIYRSRLRAEGARLAAMEDPEARAVGDAFLKAGCAAFDASEEVLMECVETQRAKVNARTDTFDQPDYGAGAGAAGGAGRTVRRVIGEFARAASSPQVWASMHFALVRAVQPALCLELGTCVGIASAYMALAQRLNAAGGRVFTLEGAPGAAAVAEANFRDLGLENITVVVGPFQETLGTVVAEHPGFGFVFIDGHHDEQATWDYFNQIAPALLDGAVVVFDDIAWSDGMRRVWSRLAADPRMAHACDLRHLGVCIYRRTGGAGA